MEIYILIFFILFFILFFFATLMWLTFFGKRFDKIDDKFRELENKLRDYHYKDLTENREQFYSIKNYIREKKF